MHVARRRQLNGIVHDDHAVSWEMDMGPGITFPFKITVDGDTCTGVATTMNGEMQIYGVRAYPPNFYEYSSNGLEFIEGHLTR